MFFEVGQISCFGCESTKRSLLCHDLFPFRNERLSGRPIYAWESMAEPAGGREGANDHPSLPGARPPTTTYSHNKPIFYPSFWGGRLNKV